MRTAILASQNKNKIKEIRAILEKYGLSVISRDDAGLPQDDIEETGTTFEENSLLKARVIFDMIRSDDSFSDYLDSPVIADDSGLMVDALDGAPGIYSARYAGEGCTYDDNNVKLLKELEDVHESAGRGAQFVTVITMVYPETSEVPDSAVKCGDVYVLTARGECNGTIGFETRGDKGFGFDPLFIPDGYDKTFAEMGPEVKNKISHRAKALDELERLLG
jgi:XTP/dITP diphosphohydrolase